jgi:SPOR domain
MLHNFKYHKKRYILGISLIVLLLFYVLFKQGVFENKALKMAKYWDQQGRLRTADSLKRAVKVTKVYKENDSDPEVKFEDKELPGENSVNMYYIIIGSFANSENAKMTAKKYDSQGYNTSIISATDRKGNKTELVSVNAFGNHDEAARYLKDLQSKVNASAWIYFQTKNQSAKK